MTQSNATVESRVTKEDAAAQYRNRQLAERAQELADYARIGYSLAHTHVIDTTEYAVFVDTFTRDNQD